MWPKRRFCFAESNWQADEFIESEEARSTRLSGWSGAGSSPKKRPRGDDDAPCTSTAPNTSCRPSRSRYKTTPRRLRGWCCAPFCSICGGVSQQTTRWWDVIAGPRSAVGILGYSLWAATTSPIAPRCPSPLDVVLVNPSSLRCSRRRGSRPAGSCRSSALSFASSPTRCSSADFPHRD